MVSHIASSILEDIVNIFSTKFVTLEEGVTPSNGQSKAVAMFTRSDAFDGCRERTSLSSVSESFLCLNERSGSCAMAMPRAQIPVFGVEI